MRFDDLEFPPGFFEDRPDNDGTGFGDIARAVGVGSLKIADIAPSLAQYLSGAGNDPYNWASRVKSWTGALADDLTEGMSESAKRASSARWLPDADAPDVWDGDVSMGAAFLLQSAMSLPSIAATVGAALVGGPAAGSAAVGGLYTASSYEDMMEQLGSAGEEEFAESVYYQTLRENGMTHERARDLTVSHVIGAKPLIAGLISAGIARGIGIEGALGRLQNMPRLRAMVTGGVGEAAAEFGQEGTVAAATEFARYEAMGKDPRVYEILQRATGGAVIGAGLGAGTGVVFGRRNVVSEDQQLALTGGQPDLFGDTNTRRAPDAEPEAVPDAPDPNQGDLFGAPAEQTTEQTDDLGDPDVDIDTVRERLSQRQQATNAVVDNALGMPSPEQTAALSELDFDGWNALSAADKARYTTEVGLPPAPVVQPAAPTAQAPLQPPVSAEGIAGTAPTVDTAALAPAPVAEAPVLPPEVTPAPVQDVAPEQQAGPVDDFNPISGVRPEGNVLRDLVAQRAFDEAQKAREQEAKKKAANTNRAKTKKGVEAEAREDRIERAGFVVRRQDVRPRKEELVDDTLLPEVAERLDRMVAAAREDGVTIPDDARIGTPDEVALLVEARNWSSRIKARGGKPLTPKQRKGLNEHLDKHFAALEGKEALAEARRGASAEMNMRGSDAASSAVADNALADTTPPGFGETETRPDVLLEAAEDADSSTNIDRSLTKKLKAVADKQAKTLTERRGEEIPQLTPKTQAAVAKATKRAALKDRAPSGGKVSLTPRAAPDPKTDPKPDPVAAAQKVSRELTAKSQATLQQEAAQAAAAEVEVAAPRSVQNDKALVDQIVDAMEEMGRFDSGESTRFMRQAAQAVLADIRSRVGSAEAEAIAQDYPEIVTAALKKPGVAASVRARDTRGLITTPAGRGSAAAVRANPSSVAKGKPMTLGARLLPLIGANPGGIQGEIWRRMVGDLRKLVSDVPVYVTDDAGMMAAVADMLADGRLTGIADGFYDPTNNMIMLNQAALADPVRRGNLILHEATHAALHDLINTNSAVRADLNAILKEAQTAFDGLTALAGQPADRPYGLSNVHELISEALSNPDFQNTLMNLSASPELSARLGLEQQRPSLWNTLVELARKYVFGNADGPPTLFEAVLRATENTMAIRMQQGGGRGRGGIFPAYENVPNSLMGFRGDGLNTPFDQQRFRHIENVLITWPDGDQMEDAVRGLNGPHALERARRNWPGATIKSLGPWEFKATPILPSMGGRARTEAGYIARSAGETVKGWGMRAATLGGLAQQLDQQAAAPGASANLKRFAELARKLTDITLSTSNIRRKAAANGNEVVQDLARLAKNNPEGYRAFEATVRDLHENGTAVVDRQNWTEQDLLDANKHVSKKRRSDKQRLKRMVELQGKFMALPSEFRTHHFKIQKFLESKMAYTAKQEIEATLAAVPADKLSDAQRADLAERVYNGRMTADDKKLINNDIIYKHLRSTRNLRKPNGTYMPAMRFGKYRVRALAGFGDLMGGKEIAPDTVEFRMATDKEAWAATEKFMEATNLDITGHLSRVFYDKKTGEQLNSEDAKRMDESEFEVGIRVPVQRQHLYSFDSRTDALRFIDENRSAFEQMDRNVLTAANTNIDTELSGTQLGAILKQIESATHLSTEAKKEASIALYQASLKMMNGVRFQQRRIISRKVGGASTDMVRVLHSYNDAFSGYYARQQTLPQANEALKQMKAMQPDTLNDAEAEQRSRYITEFGDRLAGVRDYQEPNQLVRDLLTVSFNNYLASPAYSIINSTQVAMVSYPVMAGKHGPVRAGAEIIKAYNAVGGMVAGRGITNTIAAVRQYRELGLTTDSPLALAKANLAKQPDGAFLLEVVEQGLEGVGLTDLDVGFEHSSDLVGSRGAIGDTLARVTRIARQMPQAVEIYNRIVPAVAAARLHLQRNPGDKKGAIAYARQVVESSQGDYSNENASPWIKKFPIITQFQKFPQLMAQLMLFQADQAFNGATKKEKMIAIRQLSYLAGMQVAVGGAVGLPMLELVKIPVMLAGLLGVGEGWEPWESWMEEVVTEVTDNDRFSKALMRGLLTRPLGIDVSTRINLGNLVIGFGGDDYDRDSVHAYLATRLLGAPGTMVTGFFDGMQKAGDGDWGRALPNLIPLKVVADSIKGFTDDRLSVPGAITRGIGIMPASTAERFEQFRRERSEKAAVMRERNRLNDRWRKTTSAAERRALRREIEAFNRTADFRVRTRPWNWTEQPD